MAYLPHIDLESETPRDSNYGNITLFFMGLAPQRVLSTPICPLSKLCHFLRDSHLEKPRFSSNTYFCEGSIGTNRNGVEG